VREPRWQALGQGMGTLPVSLRRAVGMS